MTPDLAEFWDLCAGVWQEDGGSEADEPLTLLNHDLCAGVWQEDGGTETDDPGHDDLRVWVCAAG